MASNRPTLHPYHSALFAHQVSQLNRIRRGITAASRILLEVQSEKEIGLDGETPVSWWNDSLQGGLTEGILALTEAMDRHLIEIGRVIPRDSIEEDQP